VNMLIENGTINRVESGTNLAYVVNDHTIFSTTEYKVLQSQSHSAFIKCMKLLYNGKIQLYYLTSGFKPLTDILNTLNARTFMTVTANILNDIISVKNNGFLSCKSVDVSLDHIYVDPITYKIGLIYLPLSKRVYSDMSAFENELRTELIKLIQNLPTVISPKTMQLAADLANGKLSLEEIHSRTKGEASIDAPSDFDRFGAESADKKTVKLVSLNAAQPFEIVVTKDIFVIGSKREIVDYAILFNKTISRSHCKIIRQGDRVAIVDVGSANGTYLNGNCIYPGQSYPIKNGDTVQLATSEFRVCIE